MWYTIEQHDQKIISSIRKRKEFLEGFVNPDLDIEKDHEAVIYSCVQSIPFFFRYLYKIESVDKYEDFQFNPLNAAMIYLASKNKNMYVNGCRTCSKDTTAIGLILYNIVFAHRSCAYVDRSDRDFILIREKLANSFDKLPPYVKEYSGLEYKEVRKHLYYLSNYVDAGDSNFIVINDCEHSRTQLKPYYDKFITRRLVAGPNNEIKSIILMDCVSDSPNNTHSQEILMKCAQFDDTMYNDPLENDLYHLNYAAVNLMDEEQYDYMKKVLNNNPGAIRRELDLVRD